MSGSALEMEREGFVFEVVMDEYLDSYSVLFF